MEETSKVLTAIADLTKEVRELKNQLAGTTFSGKFSHEHLIVSTKEQSSIEYGDTTKGGRGKVKVYIDPLNMEQSRKMIENELLLLAVLREQYDKQ